MAWRYYIDYGRNGCSEVCCDIIRTTLIRRDEGTTTTPIPEREKRFECVKPRRERERLGCLGGSKLGELCFLIIFVFFSCNAPSTEAALNGAGPVTGFFFFFFLCVLDLQFGGRETFLNYILLPLFFLISLRLRLLL